MAGTILILCSTGKTGARLAKLLHASGHHSLVLASRKGLIPAEFSGSGSPSVKAVKFDWTDPSSFGNAFALDSNIDQVYLVGPDVVNMLPPSKLFIDLAIDRGVKNFVLLSATTCEKGGPAMGEIHGYLDQIGVGYIALRPTWFIGKLTFPLFSLFSPRRPPPSPQLARDGIWMLTHKISNDPSQRILRMYY